jgi:Surface glycan-binding protein B xyloglucan binding domain
MLYKKITSISFLLIASALMIGFAGCKKNNEDSPPTVTRVRANLPTPNDSTLSKAGPGQWIVIEGTGLKNTIQAFFNGWPGSFNAALFSDNSMVVLIPADMPFASLDQSKLNTIRIVTTSGETTYTFPIEPPPPVINTMSNEMAVAGERVTLYGNNFFFVDKVIFPGNLEVTTNIQTNPSGTTLDVTVPAAIALGGPIKVVNRYGTGTSILLFNDLATGVLCNFDNVNTINNWAGVTISSDATVFPGNRGTYARMKYNNVAAGDWAWYGGGRSINVEVSKQWVPVVNLSVTPSSFAVKFEINTKVPWKNGTILLDKDYGWNYQGRYEGWNGTGGVADYNSNGWKTVVVPLSNFRQSNGTGAAAPSLTALLGAGGSGGFNLYFINAGTTSVVSFDAAVDNFRVVRVSN